MGGGEAAGSSTTLVGAGGGSHHLGTGEPPASQPLKGTTWRSTCLSIACLVRLLHLTNRWLSQGCVRSHNCYLVDSKGFTLANWCKKLSRSALAEAAKFMGTCARLVNLNPRRLQPQPLRYLISPYGLHLIQVGPSTLAVHLWPPEPVEGVPEPPAPEPAAAMLAKNHFHILPSGRAMLLSSDRKVDLGSKRFKRIHIPRSFLLQCFSPPITSSTQVTAHVVIRTQDVAKLPPGAAAAAEAAAVQDPSADKKYIQLQSFECNLVASQPSAGCLTTLMLFSPGGSTSWKQ